MPFDPASPQFVAEPRATTVRLLEPGPVVWHRSERCWIATRYADVRQVLTDPRFGHPDGFHESSVNGAALGPALPRLSHNAGRFHALWMSHRNPPDHTRLRTQLTPFFTQPAVEALQPYIQARTEELLDRVQPAGQMDLVADFADHLPFEVACQLLGVPGTERPHVRGWLRGTVKGKGLHPSPAVLAGGTLAMLRLTDYFRRLANASREQPRDDLVSALATEPSLSEDELAANCVMLLVGGELNLRAIIPISVLVLLRHPEQLEWLRRQPSMLPTALEELLRYASAAQLHRRALEDVELGGHRIRNGEGILVSTGTANHDPAQFDDPGRLDLTRTPNPHLAFASGIHSCLGARLARTELEIALDTLLRRLPDLALKPGPIEWDEQAMSRRPKALHVSF